MNDLFGDMMADMKSTLKEETILKLGGKKKDKWEARKSVPPPPAAFYRCPSPMPRRAPIHGVFISTCCQIAQETLKHTQTQTQQQQQQPPQPITRDLTPRSHFAATFPDASLQNRCRLDAATC